MAIAKGDRLVCRRCGNRIANGEKFKWGGRDGASWRAYHQGCAVAAGEQERHDHPEGEPQAPAPDPVVTPAPVVPAGGLDAILGAVVDARIQAWFPNGIPKQSREEIEEIVRGVMTPVQIVRVEVKDAPAIEIKGAHFQLDRVIRLVRAGIPVYLHGPAGTGKTTAALQVAQALGRKAYLDTLDRTTPKSGILGYRTPTGDPVWTATTLAFSIGGILIHDEMDNAPAFVQTILNSALANGEMPAAWGTISKNENFGYIACGNTPFRPTPQFPDRQMGSAAFIDRLYFVYWPMDDSIECSAAGLPCPKPPKRKGSTCSAAEWVKWVRAIREWTTQNAPTICVTPRASLLGIKALEIGETSLEVAHGLIFRGADSTLVSKALEAVPLP